VHIITCSGFIWGTIVNPLDIQNTVMIFQNLSKKSEEIKVTKKLLLGDIYSLNFGLTKTSRSAAASRHEFLGAFAEFRIKTVSMVVPTCPPTLLSVHIEKFGSQWTDFHEI
jgi:hypothetical protein